MLCGAKKSMNAGCRTQTLSQQLQLHSSSWLKIALALKRNHIPQEQQMRIVGSILKPAAIAFALATTSLALDASAQTYRTQQTAQASSTARYVSRTQRRVAVPARGYRSTSAPSGARIVRSRYWDPSTRWVVDPRTRSTYSVLRNGEVWFLDPTSGWGYTVDRYGRVYGAYPRSREIYAFSSLSSWNRDLFYFFDYFSPYDGYYTVRNYDWFYSSYYGRRYSYYDYDFAYRTMWNDFDDYWYSRNFHRSLNFCYYQPSFVRWGSGYSSSYYYDSMPSVYIAPVYNYTVVNNTVVVNNNYTTIYNNGATGRGLPTAEQAAVQMAQTTTLAPPTSFGGNNIQVAQTSADVPVVNEAIKDVSIAQMPVNNEPVIAVPGLENAAIAAGSEASQAPEPQIELPLAEPVVQQPAVQEDMSAKEPAQEQRQEPVYQEPQQQEQRYEEPAYVEPAQEQGKEPAYQEPQQQEQRYEEPAYQEPQQQEQRYEEPAYQEPQQQEQRYEAPQQQEQRYEAPQQQEQRYEAPEPARQEDSQSDDDDDAP
jgi:hypothetical protein